MKLAALIISALILASCATTTTPAKTGIREISYELPSCDRPVAKIALGDFICKASGCARSQRPVNALIQNILSLSGQPSYEGIGEGMSDMLLTALVKTGCVEVMERETIAQIRQELELLGGEVKPEAVDYLISGSVNAISVEKDNTNLGAGVLPVLSTVDLKKTSVTMGMDVRLVEVRSSKVLRTWTYEGNNSRTGFAVGGGGALSDLGFGGIYSNLKGTDLEGVARDMVIRTTSDIVQTLKELTSAQATRKNQAL